MNIFKWGGIVGLVALAGDAIYIISGWNSCRNKILSKLEGRG